MSAAHAHKPGDRLEVFDSNGRWVPCVLTSLAGYAGKSGPGYYASYDPGNPQCTTFWTNDRMLRPRAEDLK